MKKLIYTCVALSFLSVSLWAQVGIKTTSITEKSILDFPDPNQDQNNNNRGGILLPYVDLSSNNTAINEEGTLLYNTNTGGVAVYNGTAWEEIASLTGSATINQYDQLATYPETGANGVFIEDESILPGNDSNSDANYNAPGVLVLNTTSKALSLPKVEKVEDVGEALAGTIVYDKSRKSLAIYTGDDWTLLN